MDDQSQSEGSGGTALRTTKLAGRGVNGTFREGLLEGGGGGTESRGGSVKHVG